MTPEGVAGLLVSPDGAFVVARRGLYLRRLLKAGVVQITRFDLATGRRTPVRQVTPLSESVGTGGIGQLLLAADASAYAYGCGVTMSDLYLVKGLK